MDEKAYIEDLLANHTFRSRTLKPVVAQEGDAVLVTDLFKWALILQRIRANAVRQEIFRALKPMAGFPEGMDPDNPQNQDWLAGLRELRIAELRPRARRQVQDAYFDVVTVITRADVITEGR